MNNEELVYKLASEYIAGPNGTFDPSRDHLCGESYRGITYYKVGQDGPVEYYLGVSSRGTLYKRVVRHSCRIHMDAHEYNCLIASENEADNFSAYNAEEELISEEIIPLLYQSQIGFIGKDNRARSYY